MFTHMPFPRLQGRYRCFKGRLLERYGIWFRRPTAVAAGQREQALGHLQSALELDTQTARTELAGLQPLVSRISKSCLRCML